MHYSNLTIAQGVRRIVALSGAEARDAITHAKDLSEKLRELNTLEGAELETQTTAFKVVGMPARSAIDNSLLCSKPEVKRQMMHLLIGHYRSTISTLSHWLDKFPCLASMLPSTIRSILHVWPSF